jgi:hypothetical protein
MCQDTEAWVVAPHDGFERFCVSAASARDGVFGWKHHLINRDRSGIVRPASRFLVVLRACGGAQGLSAADERELDLDRHAVPD